MMECSPGPRENTIADEPASIVPGLQATENTGLCVCVEGMCVCVVNRPSHAGCDMHSLDF